MKELKQGQKVNYLGKEMIIVGFMFDGRICLEFNGFYHYVDRNDLEVI